LATVSRDSHWTTLRAHFDLYLKNDHAATQTLFEGLHQALYPFFRVRTRSETESEDLTQAALLKIHFARDRFNPELSLKTWVFTIAGRCLIDHWRGAGSENNVIDKYADQEIATEMPTLEPDPSLKAEWGHDLTLALDQLKPIDRTIVYLYVTEGLSMSEIASSVNMTESAVKVRAHRSYAQMRVFLKENP